MSVELKYKLNDKLHAEIVLGKDKSFSRSTAIAMLLSSKLPNTSDLLLKILIDKNEAPKYQRLAAATLWRMNEPTALDHLMKAAKELKGDEVLTTIVKCLGRIGDQQAFNTISGIDKNAKGVLKEQSSFALSLISYRLGLQSNDLVFPNTFVKMPVRGSQQIRALPPLKVEVDMFTSCMATEAYGIEFSKGSTLQLNCQGGQWMIAFNKDIVGSNINRLIRQRKTLLGLVAAKNSEDGRYSVAYLILTGPDSATGMVNIFINRITGAAAWAGTLSPMTSNQFGFKIQTVNRVGIVPIELDGVIDSNGKIDISRAVSGIRVIEKRYPKQVDR
jgi:hypothetical protein